MEYIKKQVEQYNELKNKNPLFPLILNSFKNLISGSISNKVVLDLGCGYGYLTRYLKIWGAKEVLGVDISEPMINLARKEKKESPIGVNYLQSSIQELGKVNSFDIITAGHLIVNAKDDMSKILEKFDKSDAFVYISPVYVRMVSAQMKLLFDRRIFLLHRPVHAEKRAMLICTASLAGGKQYLNFIKMPVANMGMHTVGRISIPPLAYKNKKCTKIIFSHN